MIRAWPAFVIFSLALLIPPSGARAFGPQMTKSVRNVIYKITNTTGRPASIVAAANAWVNGRFCTWGGHNGSAAVGTGACFNPATQTWTAMPASPLTDRFMAARGVIGTKFLIWGGRNWAGTRFSDGAIFDAVANTWSMMSASPLSARNGPSSLATGGKLLIWGGYQTGAVPTNTGALYDLAANTWTSMTLTNAPPAAVYASASWTGSKLAVWGGVGAGNAIINTGGVYDPAGDAWTTISATGAPAARTFHGAAASATKLAIFGGDSTLAGAGPLFGDGKIYDFAAGTWTAISSTFAPSARRWLGFEFIPSLGRGVLLGGADLSSSLSDIFLLDLDNNRWTKTIPAPVADTYDNGNCLWTGSGFFCNTTTPFIFVP